MSFQGYWCKEDLRGVDVDTGRLQSNSDGKLSVRLMSLLSSHPLIPQVKREGQFGDSSRSLVKAMHKSCWALRSVWAGWRRIYSCAPGLQHRQRECWYIQLTLFSSQLVLLLQYIHNISTAIAVFLSVYVHSWMAQIYNMFLSYFERLTKSFTLWTLYSHLKAAGI